MGSLGIVGGVLAAGAATWLLTYLAHSTLLLLGAWMGVRSGVVRQPRSIDLLWKFALLAGFVSATVAVIGPGRGGRTEAWSAAERFVLFPLAGDLQLRAHDGGFSSGIERGISGEPALTAWRVDGAVTLRKFDVRAWSSGPTPDLEVERATSEFWATSAARPSEACRAVVEGRGPGGLRSLENIRAACAPGSDFAWFHGLLLVWLVGVLFAGLRLTGQMRALGRLRGTLADAPRPVLDALAEVTRRGARPVTVGVSPSVGGPCVIGPSLIALPVRCATELSRAELTAVLAHEVAHVERADVLWLRAVALVSTIFWVQPLNLLAGRGLRDVSELICDDRAVATTREALGLARSIARVAEWALDARTPRLAIVASAAGGVGSLSGRIRRILAGPTTAAPLGKGRAVLAGMALLLPLLWVPSVPVSSPHRIAVFVEAGAAGPGVAADEALSGGYEARILVARLQAVGSSEP